MRKPGRLVVTAVTIPFLAGCFGVLETPIPAGLSQREALNVRGVVIADSGDGERVEFEEILEVQWTNDALFIVGSLAADEGAAQIVTRTFPLSSLSSVLVRQVDANKTSGIIAVFAVGLIAMWAFAVNGQGPGPASGGTQE